MNQSLGRGETEALAGNRPDQKLSKKNSETELLAAVLASLQIRSDRAALAEKLLHKFGSIKRIFAADCRELQAVQGLGVRAARQIQEFAILHKALLFRQVEQAVVLDNLEAVMDYFWSMLSEASREQFHCLYLDNAMVVVDHECLQVGTLNHVAVYPRELMHRALDRAAAGLILVHNHPSANDQPSVADLRMTRKICEIGKLLGVRVVDHLIVSRFNVFSFKQSGLLQV